MKYLGFLPILHSIICSNDRIYEIYETLLKDLKIVNIIVELELSKDDTKKIMTLQQVQIHYQ